MQMWRLGVVYGHLLNTRRVVEGVLLDGVDTFANDNRGESPALGKRHVADHLHLVGNDNRTDAAALECHVVYALKAVGQRNASHVVVAAESIYSNVLYSFRNDDGTQVGARRETLLSDTGDSVGHAVVHHGSRNLYSALIAVRVLIGALTCYLHRLVGRRCDSEIHTSLVEVGGRCHCRCCNDSK